MLEKIIHTLFPHKCTEHMKWQYPSTQNKAKYIGIRKEMICSRCGRNIAFKWYEKGSSHIFIHNPFKKFKRKIESMLFDEFRL